MNGIKIAKEDVALFDTPITSPKDARLVLVYLSKIIERLASGNTDVSCAAIGMANRKSGEPDFYLHVEFERMTKEEFDEHNAALEAGMAAVEEQDRKRREEMN